ncbi:MAG: long-chain fatty acid--CoA ligase [Bacteroidaceae bacterium]|nr:long-chain fatty acid--CoA ligase [Bacteroidaceae bacterium]
MLNNSPLTRIVHEQAKVYGERTAMMYPAEPGQPWNTISWREFSERVTLVSNALLACGIGIQEKLAVFSQNMPECLITDFGAYGIRAVTIPYYATSSAAQVQFMTNDAGVRIIFVGEQYQYDTMFSVMRMCPTVERIIIFSREVVKDGRDNISVYFDEFLASGQGNKFAGEITKRQEGLDDDELCNILYTSGTTGQSKGVLLTYRMYHAAFPAHDVLTTLSDKDIIMNFLPFTHVFERGWTYLCISHGCTLAVNLRPQDVQRSLREVHPTCMAAVPRFWEKVYSGVQDKIASSSPVQRRLMEDAIAVGRKYNVEYKMRGLVPPLPIRLKYKFYENTVIALLKKTLGLENANFFPTAGAAIAPEVEAFVHSTGINMVAGYGLTESLATVSCDWTGYNKTVGSVGRVLKSVTLKIGENNEILLKGDTITKGYYRQPQLTAQAIDQDGWFHTGDCGYMKNGELFLTDRIKDLFKTSNGKYISPQALESKFVVDRYIDEITIIADQHKFVSALIIPNYPLLEEWARKHDITFADRTELCRNEQVVRMVMSRIETLQQEFAHYEQVKRITLLPEPFSMAKGELTNTLKIKRPVIAENYRKEIDAMYAED